jgi:hypothetical protein
MTLTELYVYPIKSARGIAYVILGLSITSSWGNGHATTYRGLVQTSVFGWSSPARGVS